MEDTIENKIEGKGIAALCHLAAFVMWLGIPFGNILGPLFMWLFYKERYAFVADQGKESLNFQISMSLYGFVSLLIWAVSLFLVQGMLWVFFGLFVLAFLLFKIICIVSAAINANNGTKFRYPLTIRFIK